MAKDDEGLLKEAKDRFKFAEDYWADNRAAWLKAARFRTLDQWPEDLKKSREAKGRPLLVVDKLGQYVRQVVNDGRQNRPAVKVSPAHDGDPQVAEGFEGIIRHICDRSNADEAFDTSLDHAAGNGFGYIRLATEYAHGKTFDQDIRIHRVRNAVSVLLSPHQTADGSDCKYGFFIDEIPKDEFERRYPKAKIADWNHDGFTQGWSSEKYVRVVEYFYQVEEQKLLHRMGDGTIVSDEDYQIDVEALKLQGLAPPQPKESREVPDISVKWCRMTGAEILERKNWDGKYIPLIPVYGNEIDIEGRVMYTGLIFPAMDAQRLYNYSRSAYAERVALTPKAPFVAAAGQVEDFPEWETANSENHSVLRYNPIDVNGTVLPAPQRQSAADIPEGFARDMQTSEHDIQAAVGMYNASLGERSNEKSGRAILARQKEGDTSTFHYIDNLNRAIRYLGRQLVDLIPKIYDSQRVIRILAEDGTSTQAIADPNLQMPSLTKDGLTIYNLGAGTYDVTVASGPSYTTKRQEAAEAMVQLIQANPSMLQIAGDLMVRNMDWPGAEEIADRLKRMLPPQLQDQGQQQIPPEIQQAMQQVQQGQQQLQQAHQQLTQMGQQIAQEKASTDADKAKLDAARQSLQSEQKLLQSKYEELSAKLELEALKLMTPIPPVMPPGQQEPAINPQAADAAFLTPNVPGDPGA